MEGRSGTIDSEDNPETIFMPEADEESGLMIQKNLWVPNKSVHHCFD